MKGFLNNIKSDKFKYFFSGDFGVQFSFLNKKKNRNINSIFLFIKKYPPIGFLDVIPSLESLLIVFDPKITSIESIIDYLEDIILEDNEELLKSTYHWEIPVCYDRHYGLDLDHISKICKLDQDKIINIHLKKKYTVNMMGFLPGLPFLGFLDKILNISRLLEPRKIVPSGSIGIALRQCVIYPNNTPGGWNLIGRTPISIFDLRRKNPILFSVGDTVNFSKIDSKKFVYLYNKNLENPLNINCKKREFQK